MRPVRQQTNGCRDHVLLLLLLLPLASVILLLTGSEHSSATTTIGSPPVVTEQNSAPKSVSAEPDIDLITSVPTAIPQPVSETAASAQTETQNSADTNAEFLALHGEHIYPTLDSMPADMLSWYLTWVHRVAAYYDVPEEDILTVHYAELMGNGFNPLESRRSSATAAGPGQIIPQTWNGWSCGSRQTTFMTDPAQIDACGGLGTDFDLDGVANVDSLPDNLAATARHIKNDGISSSLRNNALMHENALREALSRYNSSRSYWQASAITRTYADIGIRWWRANRELIPVYLSVYAPNA